MTRGTGRLPSEAHEETVFRVSVSDTSSTSSTNTNQAQAHTGSETDPKEAALSFLTYGLQKDDAICKMPFNVAIDIVNAHISTRKRKGQRPTLRGITKWAKKQYTENELGAQGFKHTAVKTKFVKEPIEEAISRVFSRPTEQQSKSRAAPKTKAAQRKRNSRQPGDLDVVHLHGNLYAVRVDGRHANGCVCRLQRWVSKQDDAKERKLWYWMEWNVRTGLGAAK